MKQYKVSVILVYENDEQTIRDSIDSVLAQPFPNVEVICVNNGSNDGSEKILLNLTQKEDRIKLLKLPERKDISAAKSAGLGIASGKFVAFLKGSEKFSVDIINEIYYKPAIKLETQNNKLYKRSYLENDGEIAEIAEQIFEKISQQNAVVIDEQVNKINSAFDEFQKITADNIKNSSYDLTCRFNQLEKVFYQKDYEYTNKIENSAKPYFENLEKNTKQIYEDIAKTYDYINSEINQKGCEINKLYEEITKNYHYTEGLIEAKCNDVAACFDKSDIIARLEELEKEIVTRYVNLKRLLDMQADETEAKLRVIDKNVDYREIDFEAAEVEKNVSENIDNIYQTLNKTSAMFYEELSSFYKEINFKLRKQQEDEKYNFDLKVIEIKNELQKEFDEKLNQLREEINNRK